MSTISGGKGGPVNEAGVDSRGNLKVISISIADADKATEDGRSFNFRSGKLTVVGDSRTSLIVLQNNNLNEMRLTSVSFSTTPSTGGATDQVDFIQVARVSVNDAIITSGTDITVFNRNGGSPLLYTGISKVGPVTSSFASAIDVNSTFGDFKTQIRILLSTILPIGSVNAIDMIPPAGNTTMDVYITLNFHILES